MPLAQSADIKESTHSPGCAHVEISHRFIWYGNEFFVLSIIRKELFYMSNSFLDIIKSEKPVLVDFYADWCGPCKIMAPILQDVKKAMGDNVVIIKIDVDKHQQLSQQLQIQGIPTLMIFQKGEAKWRQSGVVPAKQIEQALQLYINV